MKIKSASYYIFLAIFPFAMISMVSCTKIEPYRSPYLNTKLSDVMKMKNGNNAILVRSNMGDYHLKKSAYAKAIRECNKDGKHLFVENEYKTDWDTLFISFECL